MNLKKLPNYKLTPLAIIYMILAFIIGSFLVAIPSFIDLFTKTTSFGSSDYFLLIANFFPFILAILAFDYLICRPQTGKPLNFNFSLHRLQTYFYIIPLMLGMMWISELLVSFVPTTGPILGKWYKLFEEAIEMLSGNVFLMVILVVILAPIIEEILFRGIIQKGMINNGVNPNTAIIITSIIFGLVHMNPWQFLGACLLGYVLGLVYYHTKSLFLPIFLHFFNNAIAVLFSLYTDQMDFSAAFGISVYMLAAIGLVIFIVFHYLFINYTSKLNS